MSELLDTRRLRVGKLHLRGLTPVEIAKALNISAEVVLADIQHLTEVWALESTPTPRQKAVILAEIREARRQAWSDQDTARVESLLEKEIRLLHLDEMM